MDARAPKHPYSRRLYLEAIVAVYRVDVSSFLQKVMRQQCFQQESNHIQLSQLPEPLQNFRV